MHDAITLSSRKDLVSQITTLSGLVMDIVNQSCADIIQIYFLSY